MDLVHGKRTKTTHPATQHRLLVAAFRLLCRSLAAFLMLSRGKKVKMKVDRRNVADEVESSHGVMADWCCEEFAVL